MTKKITLALSKGRLLKETLPILDALNIKPSENLLKSRKLILTTNQPELSLLVIRSTDVPTYVQMGGADMGIVGKDVLMEHGGKGLYEPLDLGIAPCKLMVAGPAKNQGDSDHKASGKRLRVATKYVNIARSYFAEQGIQAETFKLYGSMELAPLVGLADRIVDLVDTGNTLRANGLAPLEHIADISTRLIVNQASMKMKHALIQKWLKAFESVVMP